MRALLAEADYHQFIDALDHGFCVIEVLFDDGGAPIDYRFLTTNASFERETGLHDATGRRMRELAPDHEDHWFQIYGEVAMSGVPRRFEAEAAALERYYNVFAFRVSDAELRRVAVLFSDITARRSAEHALEQARQDEQRANRAKDEFLAMLGHELRNPLAPMLTALELMRLRGATSREQGVLERQVRNLTRMVDDLLDVSRITQGKIELRRQTLELRQVVVAATELAGPLLEERRVVLDLDVPESGALMNVDHARMAQALANLLTNAAKYSEPGSRIVVTGKRERNVLWISVKDEGIGLAPDMIEAVFEPFVQQPQTIDRSAGGLGLGLAIVRSLVTAHGGIVRGRSAGPHQGSEFTIELPAGDEPAHAEELTIPVPSPVQAAPAVADRILVVDDNRDAADMLRLALEQLGYTVDVAFDGETALARAESFQPSTVLLDIGLPIMDGYEVARRLRLSRFGHPLRLLALTGYGQHADRERARAAGFTHHMIKPIDLDQLQAVLASDVSSDHG